MTKYELLSVNKELLKTMDKNGIKPQHHKHIKLFEEYKQMASSGEKITYIVTLLSSVYNISERAIYRLIELFDSTAIF
jgi:predicted phosphatase